MSYLSVRAIRRSVLGLALNKHGTNTLIMITHLYPIYVNQFKRAVFNGSLRGFKSALNRLDIAFENLVQPMYGKDLLGTEIEIEFLSTKGYLTPKDEYKNTDSLGIYLSIPGFSFAPDAPFVPPPFTDDEL